MLAKRPIRIKLIVGLGLLLLSVVILFSNSLHSTYTYRSLVKDLSWRAAELPLTSRLSRQVGELRVALSELRGLRAGSFPLIDASHVFRRMQSLRDKFCEGLADVDQTLRHYRQQLESEADAGSPLADNQREWLTLREVEVALARVRDQNRAEDWVLDDALVDHLDAELESLDHLSAELPSFLYGKYDGLLDGVRSQYHTLIAAASITTAVAALALGLLLKLLHRWIFGPLGVLISGSRRVAAGDFDHRIVLETHDEMAELARALNHMTARFQDIRDDLDRQVQERTKQVVRNEQLASVGFLAAGVAHEINNPLASIALCAESLEGRLAGTLDPNNPEHEVVAHYLRMIQSEAFRCKEITEKLLDFSRVGQVRRLEVELGDLVRGVIEMVGHLGKYQQKQIRLENPQAVLVSVNPQEIKQVVLNLLTNALDSADKDGRVEVVVAGREGWAELEVIDDGCGMAPDVLDRVFEPFFTRRREGQGTGLGLSISYRIVADHGGTIEAQSAGPGQGATFRVRLPLAQKQKEAGHRYRAA